MDEQLEDELHDDPVEVELDRFSSCARAALAFAEKHAGQFGDQFVGTDHLLVGLSVVPSGAARRVLATLEVSTEQLTATMRFIRGGDPVPAPEQTERVHSPRLVRVLETAAKDAAKRNHTELGTLHLLSGILREREGLAVFLLESPGMGLGRAGSAISAAHRDGWKDEDSNHTGG